MAEIREEIRNANDRFESTFGHGDAAGMADLYTEDGMLLPAGSDFVRGRQGIQSFWQGAMDMGVKNARLETVEVEKQGDTAIEMGNYTLSDAGEQTLDQGKYMVIWKRETGGWKLHRDIWTTNLAPQ